MPEIPPPPLHVGTQTQEKKQPAQHVFAFDHPGHAFHRAGCSAQSKVAASATPVRPVQRRNNPNNRPGVQGKQRTLTRWNPHGSMPNNSTSSMKLIHSSGAQYDSFDSVHAAFTAGQENPPETTVGFSRMYSPSSS
jgi:hypothetical protein